MANISVRTEQSWQTFSLGFCYFFHFFVLDSTLLRRRSENKQCYMGVSEFDSACVIIDVGVVAAGGK